MDINKFEDLAYNTSKDGAIGATIGSILSVTPLGSAALAIGAIGGIALGVYKTMRNDAGESVKIDAVKDHQAK